MRQRIVSLLYIEKQNPYPVFTAATEDGYTKHETTINVIR